MTLDIVSIKIDRKTGERKSMEVIGTKTILQSEYEEACVNYLTGMSSYDCVKAIRNYYKSENQKLSGQVS